MVKKNSWLLCALLLLVLIAAFTFPSFYASGDEYSYVRATSSLLKGQIVEDNIYYSAGAVKVEGGFVPNVSINFPIFLMPFLLFGFTFMIWQHFYKLLKENDYYIDLSKGVLIHGGGWKKLENQSVSQGKFKEEIKAVCGVEEIFDYYGMVEQTGSIYMECEFGHLHASIFSDVIIRRSIDFSVAEIGEEGIIQVLSMIPESYPGHSLLTEDKGILLGEDNCPCQRKGKFFKVTGRIKNAEIRGCSDTYATNFN